MKNTAELLAYLEESAFPDHDNPYGYWQGFSGSLKLVQPAALGFNPAWYSTTA